MSKYLLITKGGDVEILESEPKDIWQLLVDMKYPTAFISLTVMENVEGPY